MGTKYEQVSAFCVCFFFFITVAEVGSSSQFDDCSKPKSCKHHGVPVHFPFRLKSMDQQHHSGYPGFDLSCTDAHETMLHLPHSEPFFVKTINYTSQTIDLYDPSGCTAQRLLRLNLSNSPFINKETSHSKSASVDLTFLKCSSGQTNDEECDLYRVSCLSNEGNEIFAAYERRSPANSNIEEGSSHFSLFSGCPKRKLLLTSQFSYDYIPLLDFPLASCEKVRTMAFVPVEGLDPNRKDCSFRLSWDAPTCRDCELQGKGCRLKNRYGPVTECFELIHAPHKGNISRPSITGVSVGFSFLILIIISTAKLYHMSNLDKREQENRLRIEKFLEDYKALKPTRYSYADLKRITNQFKYTLGQGGYGSVFKGKLSNEIEVAIKMLNDSQGSGEEFINEVSTIGRIHHVNVVRLVGFCADGYRRALVYEFMPNESLEKYIFSRNNGKNPFLGWKKLQDIAIGIAKGMEYLHQGCDQRILHFDIKPQNILLDENFNPKISDFGLAKLCSKGESIVSVSAARGTIGYIAPEVLLRNFGNVSYKSDVYSFGMLLLEMLGGRKNVDAKTTNGSQVYFPEWAYKCLDQGGGLEIKLESDGDEEIVKKLTIVALWCIQWYPVDRPSMKGVVQMLEGDTKSLIMPPNPFASTSQLKHSSAINPNNNNTHNKVLFVIPEQDEFDK